MKQLPFKQVDVFTDRPFRGNPLAVIINADELSQEEMQHIAHWTNLSETAFICSSTKADYRVRIFTPQSELPFAGHPTIGSAHVVREAGIVDKNVTAFTQECGAGVIALKLDEENNIYARVPQPKLLDCNLEVKELARAIAANYLIEPILIDVGPLWLVARLESGAEVSGLQVNFDRLTGLSQEAGMTGVTVYAFQEDRTVQVRSFAPAQGVPEDPVCGSGNAAVAAHLKATGQREYVGDSYLAYQGAALGRDGRVRVCFEGEDILIGGVAVTVINGTVLVES